RHLLRCACREAGLSEKEMTPEVLQWLTDRPWPGNVRELQNVVRRLSVFCPGNRIDMDVVGIVFGEKHLPSSSAQSPPAAMHAQIHYKQAKAEVVTAFTTDYLRNLLTSTRGNISEAARISGLSRVALQKIIARLGERVDTYRC
ncbi:MAG: sigma-54-dependent Fis family transcriptional regulator, partial [Desulfofustis sp.]|nr:sigma-54-dependent Fis family transcriptional regulator [Desulfofustis sp.]